MTCINTDTKDAIIEKLDKSNISSTDSQEIAEFLERLPACTASDAPKGKRGKRPLSKYNLYMRDCLKETDMRTCVIRWQEKKKQGI